MNPSSALARVLVDELVRAGVRDVVLAPGSRSAPLAFALHAADAAGLLRLHVRIDERTAGFLALGLARTSGRPVPVVTTSGTAAGNLLPAVMEASHASVPLLALSADRPAALRDTGANQTTDQVGIFGGFVRYAVDLPAPTERVGQVAYWRSVTSRCLLAATRPHAAGPGPVHLNVQLAEPLVPDDDGWLEPLDGRPEGQAWTSGAQAAKAEQVVLPSGPRTVVVAGDGALQGARLLAEAGNWPLLAEPTSGSRTGSHALRCYRLLLDSALANRVERVVVYGHPTLARPVSRLLARPDVEVVAVAATGLSWPDAGHTVSRVVAAAEPESPDPEDWLKEWQHADQVAAATVDDVVGPDLSAYTLAGAVAAALLPGGLLVVGSSNPIRDLDLMAPPYPVGERRKVIGNRGLSGIDGTVSTAVGAALGRPESTRCLAYVGDLTFLHDATGLVVGPDEPRPHLTIVVANDDGGSIFGLLEQGAPEHGAAFERVFGTPHGVDLGAWCAATATPYRRVTDVGELSSALGAPASGIEVVEVPVDRFGRRDLDARIRGSVRAALESHG